MKAKLLAILIWPLYPCAFAQALLEKSLPEGNVLTVFINCSSCYEDFIKTEIKFVNYVRDRQSADVDVFIAAQPASVEGIKYTVCFIGLKSFHSISDTLIYLTNSGNMEDDTRRELIQVIKLGLVRYVSHTKFASHLQIGCDEIPDSSFEVIDKWRSWIVNTTIAANIDGERASFNQNYGAAVSVNKTTEKIKIDLELNADYSVSRFISENDDTSLTFTDTRQAYGRCIKSINKHWSAGLFGKGGSATYNNQKLYISGAPGIEYNFFPYSKWQQKSLTIDWFISANHYKYTDTTIYDEIEEDLFQNSLSISLGVTQPWGSAGFSLSGSHYFNDLKKNHLSLSANIDIRLFKGFYFSIYTAYVLVHDQMSLPKGGTSRDEQLLHRKEIATSYVFNMSSGITYRFGSKFSNTVNPRLSSLAF
ncbi:MAG: hypothetical protein K0Q95_3173 [Bacteroidota bacterium]|jgi:hypothetical protein|nr:hypothetical protein [Bacteroidota bacterium]